MKATEAIEQFIKERKNQLIDEAVKYIGKSRYLQKINKESYYYVETLRNYKEIFSDKKKAEELALKILNKIPAFQKFAEKNSMLAGLFWPVHHHPLHHFPGVEVPYLLLMVWRAGHRCSSLLQ